MRDMIENHFTSLTYTNTRVGFGSVPVFILASVFSLIKTILLRLLYENKNTLGPIL